MSRARGAGLVLVPLTLLAPAGLAGLVALVAPERRTGAVLLAAGLLALVAAAGGLATRQLRRAAAREAVVGARLADSEADRAAAIEAAALAADRADGLAARVADLERSNADLEEFASIASHDLREPLRKVASFTQLLARRYEGQLDERADQYIRYAVDGARRMQHLVDDLLGLSRVGRSGRVGEVDLAALAEQVLADLAGAIELSGAVVRTDGLPVVRGEAGLLGQLLANLVRNSLAYRAERPLVVELRAERDGDQWLLTCADTGIGIDPVDAERVFVLFERVRVRPGEPGTGIGLALCRRIVEHHGGRIWVEQQDGPGATIRWTLPV